MRTITTIVLHTSGPADSAGLPLAGTDHSAATIDAWHRQLGWGGIGYHFVVRKSGVVEAGRPLEQAGAHVSGYNAYTVGICCSGNGDIEPWTPAQHASVLALSADLCRRFNLQADQVVGHREFPGVTKTCPGLMVDLQAVRAGVAERLGVQAPVLGEEGP